jgi:hypothetical protein
MLLRDADYLNSTYSQSEMNRAGLAVFLYDFNRGLSINFSDHLSHFSSGTVVTNGTKTSVKKFGCGDYRMLNASESIG